MNGLATLLLWSILFVLCWPLAIIILILWPLIWLVMVPFRLIGFTFSCIFTAATFLLFLPFNVINSLLLTNNKAKHA